MGFRTRAAGIAAAGVLGAGVIGAIAVPFVGGWEGLRLNAYYDPVGIPTICYGHTAGVEIGQFKTKRECDAQLAAEVAVFAQEVDRLVTVDMPNTRHAALTSFAYNVGIGAFARSTLLKKLNAGDAIGACNELPRWVYAKGKKLRGLVRRRHAERELCLEGEI